MDYKETIDYLAQNLNVKESQIKRSFSTTNALRGMNLPESDYVLNERDADDYIHACGGKIPVKLYLLQVKYEQNLRKAMIYNYKAIKNGIEKIMVTTSPEKEEKSNLWLDDMLRRI